MRPSLGMAAVSERDLSRRATALHHSSRASAENIVLPAKSHDAMLRYSKPVAIGSRRERLRHAQRHCLGIDVPGVGEAELQEL